MQGQKRVCTAVLFAFLLAAAYSNANQEPVAPIPQEIELDVLKVQLGEKLYHDPRLSKDNTISCASCHDLAKAGTDNLPVSPGISGQLGEVNSPTVFNSQYNHAQFWDGRAATLEEQVDGPVNNPKEMGSNWPEVIAKLKEDPEYVKAFAAIYVNGIDAAAIQNAIAEFERSLITPDSRFDMYLRGNEKALTKQEKKGYELFKSEGCISCHNGINLGGQQYQRMGLVSDYFAERGNVTRADFGRFNVTGKESDRYVFRVPSLRNVEHTAPYFHDGQVKTLKEAVQFMAKYQLGKKLTQPQVNAIVAFLKTLSAPPLAREKFQPEAKQAE